MRDEIRIARYLREVIHVGGLGIRQFREGIPFCLVTKSVLMYWPLRWWLRLQILT